MTIKEQLKQIIQKYNLINATYDSFWSNYNKYIIENSDQAKKYGLIDSTPVETYLFSTGFKAFPDERELIVIDIKMYNITGRKNTFHYLGDYEARYNLDGTFEDDSFNVE